MFDSREETLKKQALLEIKREVERLKKLKKDEKNYLSKAKIVTRSCLLIALADGVLKKEEIFKMYRVIFKRYHIPEELARIYTGSLIKNVLIDSIKKEVEENEIDRDFLNDLYEQLILLKQVDGVSSPEEDYLSYILFNIFTGQKSIKTSK